MKTNKIKPIKKIMIFTIITVMIVSLFAVPTFAVDGISSPEELIPQPTNLVTNTIGANVNGYYIISMTYENLTDIQSQMNIAGYSSMVDIYRSGLSTDLVDIEKDGITERYYWVVDIRFDAGAGQIYISYDDDDASDRIYLDDIDKLTIYYYTYPYPVIISSSASVFFWRTAQYETAVLGEYGVVIEPEEPDNPEEPTDPTPPADGEEQGIFAVWSKITQWIVQGLASVSNAFYANGKLTLLGTLCIIPIALGLAFLLIAIIQKFLRLRG